MRGSAGPARMPPLTDAGPGLPDGVSQADAGRQPHNTGRPGRHVRGDIRVSAVDVVGEEAVYGGAHVIGDTGGTSSVSARRELRLWGKSGRPAWLVQNHKRRTEFPWRVG